MQISQTAGAGAIARISRNRAGFFPPAFHLGRAASLLAETLRRSALVSLELCIQRSKITALNRWCLQLRLSMSVYGLAASIGVPA